MSIESAMIAQAGPFILNARTQEMVGKEIGKGCVEPIGAIPVALEPPFSALSGLTHQEGDRVRLNSTTETVPSTCELIRLRVWISPKQKFEWNRCELFLKQLIRCGRIAFEMAGNEMEIQLSIQCRRDVAPVVETAFTGSFECCRLLSSEDCIMDAIPRLEGQFFTTEYHPEPPYYRLLTTFDELKTSPFETLLCALQRLGSQEIGFYQCQFQATRAEHDWHHNIERLVDLEYGLKLNTNLWVANQFTQQSPS